MKVLQPLTAYIGGIGAPELIMILIVVVVPIVAVACVVAVVVRRNNAERKQFAATHKKCPDCAEMVLADAHVCKHCGFRFDAAQATSA